MNELIKFDSISFLSEIEGKDKISEKIKVINKVLNQEPLIVKNLKDEMRKKGLNPSNQQDFDYVPIEVVEEGLRQVFFRQVDFIIKSHSRDLNSYIIVASIHYKDPITHEKRVIDGIGAKSIQQDKQAAISSFNESMKKNGLELAVGIAYSRAIKNAAKKLGKAFGADLNRDEEIDNIYFFNKGLNLSKDNDKPELHPGHEKWSSAIKSLKSGKANIKSIEKHYNLSEENRETLLSHAI